MQLFILTSPPRSSIRACLDLVYTSSIPPHFFSISKKWWWAIGFRSTLRWMEEILHHRNDGWNPRNSGKSPPINWCRISQPSSVFFGNPNLVHRDWWYRGPQADVTCHQRIRQGLSAGNDWVTSRHVPEIYRKYDWVCWGYQHKIQKWDLRCCSFFRLMI